MAKSSAHIEPGNEGYFSHNSRQSFSQSQVFFDETNEVDLTKEEAFKIFRSELAARSEAYEKRVKQKIQRNTVTQLSAIVNLNQHHTLDDLKPIIDFIEKKLDTKIIQRAIHRDEGKLVHKTTEETLTSGEQFFCNPKDKKLYFDQEYKVPVDMHEWNIEKNYHAHLELLGIDSTGKSIRRNLTTTFFRELQDITADTLKMERGQKTKSYTKEQMTQIISAIGKKDTYGSEKEYASAFTSKAKELGIYINKYASKRKSTHQYKQDKAIENKATTEAVKGIKAKATKSNKAKRATIKQLKDLNKELRAELQQSGGTREAYALLEEEIRQFKQQIKDKELSEAELDKKIEELSNTIKTKNDLIGQAEDLLLDQEDKIDKLETKIEELENKEPEKVEVEKIVYQEDTTRIKELETQINTQEQTISDKDIQTSHLETQNQALKDKIATLPSSDTFEELKTLKNAYIKLREEKNKLYDEAYEVKTMELDPGVHHTIALPYKDHYLTSQKEINTLKLKLEEKEEEIEILEEGYSKIEDTVFGKDENRSVEEIVEGVNTIATILSNVSKYLKIGMGKLVELFTNDVPGKEEIEKEQPNKIESVLPKENNSSSGIKPMKP